MNVQENLINSRVGKALFCCSLTVKNVGTGQSQNHAGSMEVKATSVNKN